MRIRKQALKLLGWADASSLSSSSSRFHSSPVTNFCLPPPATSSAEASADKFQCQLNLSPWDAIDGSHHCTNSQEEVERGNEHAAAAAGVIGNGFEFEVKEEQFTSSGSAALEKEEDAEVKKDKKKVRTRKSREMKEMDEAAAALDDPHEISTMKYCKKTDGKGWHCKRPAQLPHSLCGYHLAQHRSYSNHREEASLDGVHKNKPLSEATFSNYYYYYSVFGPWRSKRRGLPSEDVDRESSESHESSSEEAMAPQVGSDQTDRDEEEGDGGRLQLAGERQRRKKQFKRRGRKRVKARSLKSLL